MAVIITTVIEEKLGLKSDGAKGLMEIMVIEHADKPSQNYFSGTKDAFDGFLFTIRCTQSSKRVRLLPVVDHG